MTFIYSKHVLEEIDERKIFRDLIERVLQIENIMCYRRASSGRTESDDSRCH